MSRWLSKYNDGRRTPGRPGRQQCPSPSQGDVVTSQRNEDDKNADKQRNNYEVRLGFNRVQNAAKQTDALQGMVSLHFTELIKHDSASKTTGTYSINEL